jgi:hypothetical protein
LNQNALAGHVEEQAMTEHAFRTQHLTHSILGYPRYSSTWIMTSPGSFRGLNSPLLMPM